MKKIILALIFSVHIPVFSMHPGRGWSISDIEPVTHNDIVTFYQYTQPIGDENHVCCIPNELIQTVLLWADYNAGRNFLATCHLFQETPYKLNCPPFAIILDDFGWYTCYYTHLTPMALLATNRLVTYKNPLKIQTRDPDKDNIRYFFDALKQALLINELCIENNSLQFLKSLAKYLKTNKKINTLSVTQAFKDHGNTALKLARSLSLNKSITAFSLRNSNIQSNVVLLGMLMTNPMLTTLNLDNTRLNHTAIAAIAHHLKHNTTLTSLSLKDNTLGSEPQNADLLSDALKTNTTLTELYVDNNALKYAGAATFAECLVVNNTLKKLSLRNNNIGMQGASLLAPYNLTYNLDGRELVALACSQSNSRLATELLIRTFYLAHGICWAGLAVASGPSIGGAIASGGMAFISFKAIFE